MEDEKYLEDLNIKIDVYTTFLKGIEEVMFKYEYELYYKFLYQDILTNPSVYDDLIKEVQTVVKYYINKKQYTPYVKTLYENISQMSIYLPSFTLIENLADEVQRYYEILLENNILFNRATISSALLYVDKPEINSLVELLKQNIKNVPLSDEENITIEQFSESERYIWEYVELLDKDIFGK